MAIAIVVLDAFRRILEKLRRLSSEVRETPAVMQGFKLQILVANFPADRRQLFTQDFDLVEPLVPRRIDVQSPSRLKQLRSGVRLFGERLCLLQCRFSFAALRAYMNSERRTKPKLRINFQTCAQLWIRDTLRLHDCGS